MNLKFESEIGEECHYHVETGILQWNCTGNTCILLQIKNSILLWFEFVSILIRYWDARPSHLCLMQAATNSSTKRSTGQSCCTAPHVRQFFEGSDCHSATNRIDVRPTPHFLAPPPQATYPFKPSCDPLSLPFQPCVLAQNFNHPSTNHGKTHILIIPNLKIFFMRASRAKNGANTMRVDLWKHWIPNWKRYPITVNWL